jgi:putative ABC transport system permease protein
MRTREYFVSHRSHLLASETLTAGAFWSADPGRQEVSLDAELAANLGVALGDTLTLDVQGVPIDAVVSSFRRIDWLAMRPNAMIVLSPGPIERAPGMFVAAARVEPVSARQSLQAELVSEHPNLTIVDATEAAQTVLLIIRRVSSVFALLGLAAAGVGAVIVAGAIAAGRFARQRESMLLKVLGASRSDLRRILTLEYSLLATLGVASGWLLAEASNRLAMTRLFGAEPRVPYGVLALVAIAIVLSNTLVGLLVGRSTARATPLSVLRES